MADFSNIASLVVNEETLREYTFDLIQGEPSIWLAPATDENKPYLEERLRLALEAAEQAPRLPRGKRPKITAAQMAADMEKDRETNRVLLARCCARKWGTTPVDATGNKPEFSEQNCYDFLKALPSHMFDPFQNWAGNIYNFVERPPISSAAGEALGEELPKG